MSVVLSWIQVTCMILYYDVMLNMIVYFGPDIDMPEKEKNKLQELLSDLSLGSAHPPQSSTPIPARRQMSDAGIQCDAQSATSSLSGSSTTSDEMTGN